MTFLSVDLVLSSSHPQLHFLPGLLVQVDGVQLRPADGVHVGLVALPEVYHLQDSQSQSFVWNQNECAEKGPSAGCERKQVANSMRTDLIAHLGNERRLPRNEIGDPRRGPELVGDFSVDGRPGLWTLRRNRDVCENMAQIFDTRPNIWQHITTYPRRLVLGLLGFHFAALHRLLWFFLLVAVLLLLLLLFLFLLVLVLLF